MADTPITILNNFGSFAANPTGDADGGHGNSVVWDIWRHQKASPKIWFDNPAATTSRVLNCRIYTTVDGTRDGTRDWEEDVDFGGGALFKDIATLGHEHGTIATQPPDGSKVWIYTGYRSDKILQTRHASKNRGEAAEYTDTAVELTDRHASPDQVPAIGDTPNTVYVYAPVLIVGDSDGTEEDIIAPVQDSNGQGDGDGQDHLGSLTRLGFELERSVIVNAVSGSNWGAWMITYAANQAWFDYILNLAPKVVLNPFIGINDYRHDLTPEAGVAVVDATVADWEATFAPTHPTLYLHMWTYPVEELSNLISAGAEDPAGAQAARKAGNDRIRELTGITRYTGYSDAAHAIDDPNDEDQPRQDLGNPVNVQNGVHFPAFGFEVMIRAFNATEWPNMTAWTRPLLAPPFVVGEDANGVTFVDCNVIANIFEVPELLSALEGISVNFSGGIANVVAGYAVEPDATVEKPRYTYQCRLYFDRGIEAGETFDMNAISVDPDTCSLLGADGRAAVFYPFNNDASYADNNSTYVAPTGSDEVTAITDRTFGVGTDDDDITEFFSATGAPSISGGKLHFADGNTGVINGATYVFENDEGGGHGRPRILVETSDWMVGAPNGQLQIIMTANTTVPANDAARLQFLIEDVGGAKHFFARGSDQDLVHYNIPGFNTAHVNRLTVAFLPPTTGHRDRFTWAVYDVTAGVARVAETLVEVPDATQSGFRPDTNAAHRIAFYATGGTVDITRLKIDKLTTDATPPTFPADHPDAGAAYIDASGANIVVPMSESLTQQEITGFTGDGFTIERAIAVSDFAVILELATANRRLATDADGDTFDYAGGSGAGKLGDVSNNYALAVSNKAVRNDSIWDGTSEVPPTPPDPEPEPDDNAPPFPILAYGVPTSNLPVNLRRFDTPTRTRRSN